jgi:hypothetical protein
MVPLLESLDKICHKEFKCSIINFPTCGTLTWYGWTQNLPLCVIDKKYDSNRNIINRKNG